MQKSRAAVSLILSFLVAGGGLRADVAGGLVAYWSFDRDFTADAGGSAYDLQAYHVEGSESFSEIVPGGKFGGAAAFERVNEEFLFTGASVYMSGSNMSYMAWYRLDTTISGTNRYFIMETTDSNYVISYGLRETAAVDQGQVYTINTDGTNKNFYVNNGSSTGADSGQWYNMIVTFDASLNGGTYTAYLNGESAGMMDQVGIIPDGVGLIIGGHRAGLGRNFEGLIDDVAVWNRVLTADEINTLQTQAVPEPGTLALIGTALLGLFSFRRVRASYNVYTG